MLAKKKVRSMQNLNLILSFELFTKFLPRQKVSHAEVHRKIVRLKNVLRKNVRRKNVRLNFLVASKHFQNRKCFQNRELTNVKYPKSAEKNFQNYREKLTPEIFSTRFSYARKPLT